MDLQSAFTELQERIMHLEQVFGDLLWAVVQGQPTAGSGHVLIDQYEAITNDAMARVIAAKAAVEGGRVAIADRFDVAETRRALAACHAQIRDLTHAFYGDLVAFDRVDALNKLARARGGEWAVWVQGVHDALGRCPQALYEVDQAIAAGWQDLIERMSLIAISATIWNGATEARHRVKPGGDVQRHLVMDISKKT